MLGVDTVSSVGVHGVAAGSSVRGRAQRASARIHGFKPGRGCAWWITLICAQRIAVASCWFLPRTASEGGNALVGRRERHYARASLPSPRWPVKHLLEVVSAGDMRADVPVDAGGGEAARSEPWRGEEHSDAAPSWSSWFPGGDSGDSAPTTATSPLTPPCTFKGPRQKPSCPWRLALGARPSPPRARTGPSNCGTC